MIKIGRCPGNGGVTDITVLVCWQVVSGLALFNTIIVATPAVTRYSRMIKVRRQPGKRGMANIAILACW